MKNQKPKPAVTGAELLEALVLLSDAIIPIREGKRDGGSFGRLSLAHEEASKVIHKALGGSK